MTNNLTQGGGFNDDGDFDGNGGSPEFLKLLEATVLAAGHYVIPSDNLRPHTLEAARDHDSDRRVLYKFAKFGLAMAVCGCISLPVFDRLASWRERVSSPSSLQMIEIAQKKNVGIDWGLFEAFSELRQNQALRFGQASTRKVQD